jgi:hypothetical protein
MPVVPIRRLVLLLLAALCFGGLDAAGAAAAKMKLHHHHGGGMEEEEEIIVPGEFRILSRNLAFTTSVGALECPWAEVRSQLAAEEGTKSIALEAFKAEAFGEAGPGSSCRSSLSEGPAVLTASGLPWQGELTAKGAFELKGEVGFELTFPGDPGVECSYATKKLKSTYTAGSAGKPAPIEIATTAQKLTRSKGASSPSCPKKGTLSALWDTNLEAEVER